MLLARQWWGSFLMVAALLTVSPVIAQEPPKSTELHRADLALGLEMEVIVAIVEVAPGSTLPRHTHYGTEAVYFLQGGTIQLPTGDKREIKTGFTVVNNRGVPHAGFTVVGDQTIKMFVVYSVDKGKPLRTDVQ